MNQMISIGLFAILFFSCGEEPLSPEEIEAQAEAADTRAKITMNMSEGLVLTLGIANFSQPVAILSFELIFDPSALQLNSYVGADFGAPAYSMNEVSDSTFTSFSFYNNISNSGNLLDLVFQSRGSYDESVIFLRKVELLDANGSVIEFTTDDFYTEAICYIREHPTNSEIPSPCPEDDYCWTNKFCWQADTYIPQQ